ncbi:hypothetical protein R1flu_026358 [Riccia fluitans]|uniref:Uncharacterized protein n=1 Tax=Riccia fluitans TaxID=41844 RepID=A0ABD1XFS3_9MARC
MGLIFVPYMHETLRKNFHQRVSVESTPEAHHRGSTSTESNSYQSLEDLVRLYDNPRSETPEIDALEASGSSPGGEPEPSDSTTPQTETVPRAPTEHMISFFPLRRPQSATPGSTAVSSIDRRTVRLFEVLSAYYVRSAYDRARANVSTLLPPPAATAAASSSGSLGATSSLNPSSPSSSTSRSIGLQQGNRTSSNNPQPQVSTERDNDHDRAVRLARAFATVRARSSLNNNADDAESSSRRPQFILRPNPTEVSPEELRLSNGHNGPLTFHSSSSDGVHDSDPGRPRLINPGPRLLRSPDRRPGEEEDQFPSIFRRRVFDLSSSSSSGNHGSNSELDSELPENSNPQAYLWHYETRTSVTTHGCLRVIMQRHPGWEEQPAQSGFVEYWHYSTVPRPESQGFEVVRDGVARLPWPMLGLAGLETLRSFAFQINSVHHRDSPFTEYRGNIFDVILMPFHNALTPPEDTRG